MALRVGDQKAVMRRLNEGFPSDWIDAHGRTHSPEQQCYACLKRNDCTTQEIERAHRGRWNKSIGMCANRTTGVPVIMIEGILIEPGTVIVASDAWAYPLTFRFSWS